MALAAVRLHRHQHQACRSILRLPQAVPARAGPGGSIAIGAHHGDKLGIMPTARYTGPPMDLSNMRAEGVCHHSAMLTWASLGRSVRGSPRIHSGGPETANAVPCRGSLAQSGIALVLGLLGALLGMPMARRNLVTQPVEHIRPPRTAEAVPSAGTMRRFAKGSFVTLSHRWRARCSAHLARKPYRSGGDC